MVKFKNLTIDLHHPSFVVTLGGLEFPAWPVPRSKKNIIVDLRLMKTGKVNGRKVTLPVFYKDNLLMAGVPESIIAAALTSDPQGVLVMQRPKKHARREP